MVPTPCAPVRIADVMRPPELYVHQDATLLDAARSLCFSGGQPVVVIDREERCCGVLTDGHLAPYQACDARYLRQLRVGDLRFTRWPFLRPDMPAKTALRLMAERGLGVLPVVDEEGYPLGVVHEDDLVLALAG